MSSTNFYAYYNNIICPKLQALDILSKGNYSNIKIHNLANLLEITENEIKSIIKKKKIKNINSDNLHIIMLNGSSYICRIFRRILNINCPDIYAPEDIAYVYGLSITEIYSICQRLNIEEITPQNINTIFKNVNL